ncbi:MAG: cyclic nucleotide-binding domain-containing protein [Pseudobdellovibrionaceae bacterium]
MNLHPAEIAKELKQFSFFKSFGEDLVLQFATMVEVIEFRPGQIILSEGEQNFSLYFLRSGVVEIVLGGEVITKITQVGSVMGEMSVITSNPVSTTLRSETDAVCFKVNVQHFDHLRAQQKDHFQALLYKVYSNILVDRLMKTNEKARLFEIMNRELHEARNALKHGAGGKVLFVQSNKKQQQLAKMAVGGTGVELDIASTLEEGFEKIKSGSYDMILCEDYYIDIIKKAHEEKKAKHLVLIANKDISTSIKTLKKELFINNVISLDQEDRNSTVKNILITLTKVLNHDLFGIEKYLSWGIEIHSKTVVKSSQREELRTEMQTYFKNIGIRNTILDKINIVSEEMLMNAIYDAPTTAQGKSVFNGLSRQNEIHLESHQQSHLRYASDGVVLAVAVEDPFGSLTKDIIIKYLESCYTGQAGSMNQDKGGAGRGLHQIVENSDITIFNVKKGFRTEVICLFNLDGQKKIEYPSLHYFFVEK